MDTQTLTRIHIEDLLRDRINRAAEDIFMQNAEALRVHGIVTLDIKVVFSHITPSPPVPPTYPQTPAV